jgi:ankyrin repeat protein
VDALATDMDEDPAFDPKNRMPVPRDLLRLCSSLVVVVGGPDLEQVRLAHFSVKEYLVSSHVSRAYENLSRETIASSFLTRLCLRHLIGVSQLTVRDRLVSSFRPGEIDDEFPFVCYCGEHWMKHARKVESEDQGLCEMVLNFFEKEHKAFSLFARVYDHYTYGNSTKNGSRLAYAASGGLTQTIANLVDRGEDINAHGGAALEAASRKGRHTTVQFLLDRGADVNSGNGAALIAAAHGSYETTVHGKYQTTVQLLLDRGADINARDGEALIAAVRHGQDITIQLLLDRGADIDARDGEALIAAVRRGEDTTIQLLLDRGADINARDGGALITAVEHRGNTTIRLLLDRGAKIDVRHGEALIQAADRCKDPTIRLLLESGAHVNGRALILALGTCQDTTWQLLIDKGAKPDSHSVLILTALQDISWSAYERLVEYLLGNNTSRADELESAWLKQIHRIARRLIDQGADTELPGIEWLDTLRADGWSAQIVQQMLEKHTPLEANHLVSAMMDTDPQSGTIVSVMLPYLSLAAAAKKSFEKRWNLMHYAAVCASETVTQRCLDLGVDVHAEDRWKRTPLHYAAHLGHLAIVKMLVRAGANVDTLDLKTMMSDDCLQDDRSPAYDSDVYYLEIGDKWRGSTSRRGMIQYLLQRQGRWVCSSFFRLPRSRALQVRSPPEGRLGKLVFQMCSWAWRPLSQMMIRNPATTIQDYDRPPPSSRSPDEYLIFLTTEYGIPRKVPRKEHPMTLAEAAKRADAAESEAHQEHVTF